LAFHGIYGPILYCFQHKVRYWSKIGIFLYPSCIQHPR